MNELRCTCDEPKEMNPLDPLSELCLLHDIVDQENYDFCLNCGAGSHIEDDCEYFLELDEAREILSV